VAWTYHDVLPPYLFPKAGKRLRSAVTTRPARLADLTVVTNEGDRLQLDGVARNLVRIPIGSNIPSLAVAAEERTVLRTRFGYTEDVFVVGYFGFLNRSKGGLTLVRTLSRLQRSLPGARLLMIGERVGASDPTNYAYLQEVEALIEELGLNTSVQWTGHLSDEDVGRTLAMTDALLMPYEDGASLRRGTLMAGLGHGCAVVTTRPQTPIPELVQERDLLYVPAGDASAAAEAVLRIAREPGLARTLRDGARDSSRQFTWEAIAQQHVTCYESIDD
jgi:glycosyltransferase involved in cell wall biosynthesis